jgi:hypothetical protein
MHDSHGLICSTVKVFLVTSGRKGTLCSTDLGYTTSRNMGYVLGTFVAFTLPIALGVSVSSVLSMAAIRL